MLKVLFRRDIDGELLLGLLVTGEEIERDSDIGQWKEKTKEYHPVTEEDNSKKTRRKEMVLFRLHCTRYRRTKKKKKEKKKRCPSPFIRSVSDHRL